MNYREEMKQLRDTLNAHGYRYYVLDAPTIPDFEYDRMLRRLEDLEKEHPEEITPDSPTQRVGGRILAAFESVEHEVPLESLQDVFSPEEVNEFGTRMAESLHQVAYSVEPKVDGLSVALEYRDGIFVRGATRGDGRIGEDVTENLRTIKSIPMTLPEKLPHLIVRGEVYMSHRVFDELNAMREINGEPLFANPRNAAAGSLRQPVSYTHLDVYKRQLQETVVNDGYDIGVAYDGDADRCLMVDEKGNIIDGDKIMAVCAMDMRRAGKLNGNAIVATVMSNLGLHEFCQREKIQLVCTDVGDRHVLEEMLACGYCIGGEQSGHMIYTEYATTGDGELTSLQFLQILKRSGKRASELVSCCAQYPQVLVNVPVASRRGAKEEIMASEVLAAAIRKQEEKLGQEGRILLRPSGTEALIRVMVEAKTEEMAHYYAEELVNVVKSLKIS